MHKRRQNLVEPDFNGNMFTNPNVNTSFWKERCVNESDHKYKSTIKGVYLGRVNNVPVTDQFASKVSKDSVRDPFNVASSINREEKERNQKFPMKRLFGTNRANRKLVLPVDNREFHNLSHQSGLRKSLNKYKASIKTYDHENQMPWMGSAINIQQPEIKRFIFDNYKSANNSPRSNRSSQKSLVPTHYDSQNKINNYEYLSGITKKNEEFRDMRLRQSRILQSSARQEYDNKSQRKDFNKSMMSNQLNATLDRAGIPHFSDHTVNNDHNRSMVNRPSPIKPIQSLKERYQAKMGYITDPIKEVRAPEISTLKSYF